MSIEVTCLECGEEFDSRHVRCPACPHKVGETVAWTSQSAGIVKTKRGTVLHVLAPGERPAPGMGVRYPGMSRDHTSYVIAVPRAGRKTGRTYWPRVDHLEWSEDDDE